MPTTGQRSSGFASRRPWVRTLPLIALLAAGVGAQSAPPAAGPLAVVGVHVLPMTEDVVLRDQTVLLRDGRIERIGPVAEVAVPADAVRVEGRGRFLGPGLCDAHVHLLDEGDLAVYLAHGVTTVRNMKGGPWALELRDRIGRGELAGPRVLTAGPHVNEPECRTAEDVRRAVAAHVAAGYDMLKIHGELADEAYVALLEEAARVALPVVGHVPRNLPMQRVLELGGQAEISHAEEYLYAHFDGLAGDATAAEVEGIARATASAGVTVTPTLVAFRSIVEQIEDFDRVLQDPRVAQVAPPGRRTWQRDINRYAQRFSAADVPVMQARFELLERLTRALQAAGVRLLCGSDAMNPMVVPGASLHDELELLVAAGLTPFQALRAATANAGAFLGDGSGLVAAGAPADLVLFARNPLEDIGNVRAIEGVVVRGRWLSGAELARETAALLDAYAREQPFLAEVGLDGLQRALDSLAQARELDPAARPFRAAGLESLAVILASGGLLPAAQQAAELATREFPERWTAWSRLADVRLSLDDRAGARAALERALQLHPGDERLQRRLDAEVAGD